MVTFAFSARLNSALCSAPFSSFSDLYNFSCNRWCLTDFSCCWNACLDIPYWRKGELKKYLLQDLHFTDIFHKSCTFNHVEHANSTTKENIFKLRRTMILANENVRNFFRCIIIVANSFIEKESPNFFEPSCWHSNLLSTGYLWCYTLNK